MEQKSLDFRKEDVKETPKTIEGVLISHKVCPEKEIFPKPKTVDRDGKEIEEPERFLICLDWENDELGMKQTEYITYFDKDKITDNSKLGKFLLKYEEFKVGTVMDFERNEKGFYKLKL